LRIGYHWPSIFDDSYKFVQSCNECPRAFGKEKLSTTALQPILHEFSFSKWGLDFIGPINPPSSFGHVFILTATYYFTKWVEVVPIKYAKYDQVIFFS